MWCISAFCRYLIWLKKNADLADLFKNAHALLNQLLLLVLAGHIGAALKHHYLERDDVLTRMLPFLKQR